MSEARRYIRGFPFSLGDDYGVAYGYDDFCRFASVSSSVDSVSSVVNYSYLPGSGLIAGYTAGPLTVIKTYEPHRDLITQVRNETPAGTVSQYDYVNAAAGRRVSRADSGLAFFAQPQTNSFGYNARSEVTSAIMYTNTYGYAFDSIGNRLVSSHNAETNLYASNPLNQYTDIAPPSSSSAQSAVNLTPLYDADGNMTFDGKEWHYTWNGENRLVTASNSAHVVVYAYDCQGRMVAKAVDGLVRAYIWDGWNIIAEKLMHSRTNEQTNSHIWGLDLSGTLQGAGGVGGLLAVFDRDGQFFSVCDANGNVTEYIDLDGGIAAHREYSVFGETRMLAEILPDSFFFWWSSKPWCPVTELNEYELRKYCPLQGRWLSRDPVLETGFKMCRDALLAMDARQSKYARLEKYLEKRHYSAIEIAELIQHIKALEFEQNIMTSINGYDFVLNSPADGVDPLGDIPEWLKKILDHVKNAASYICPSPGGELVGAAECGPGLGYLTYRGKLSRELESALLFENYPRAEELEKMIRDLDAKYVDGVKDCLKQKCCSTNDVPVGQQNKQTSIKKKRGLG